MMRAFAIGACCLGLAQPVMAQTLSDDHKGYISANIIGIFYHELGHALIDLLEVPIYEREEDAADTLSILMVDYIFDEQSAESIAYDMAFTFAYDSETSTHRFWDQHSSDEKRMYNTVCLFYGADVDGRADFAQELEVVPSRHTTKCEDKREIADEVWGEILNDATDESKSKNWLNYTGPGTARSLPAKLLAKTISEEVRELNKWMVLPENLKIGVQDCGEANAYYDPQTIEIIMCTEYADYLLEQAKL